MRKQFKEDNETANLITTQFVFAEVPPRGDEIELFKKVYSVQINDAKDLPSSFILSAKGELISRLPGMVAPDKLRDALKEGIEKTGGYKGAEGAKRRREAALKEVESAKGQLESEDSALEGFLTLSKLERQPAGKIVEVKKAIRTILGKAATDATQKVILQQARMLDVAQAHVDGQRKTAAITQYQAVIKKFPDTPAATLAEEKLGELQGSTTSDKDSKEAKATASNDEEKAEKSETSKDSDE